MMIQQPTIDITTRRLTFSLAKGKMEKGFESPVLFVDQNKRQIRCPAIDITASRLTSALLKGRMEEGLRSAICPETESFSAKDHGWDARESTEFRPFSKGEFKRGIRVSYPF